MEDVLFTPLGNEWFPHPLVNLASRFSAENDSQLLLYPQGYLAVPVSRVLLSLWPFLKPHSQTKLGIPLIVLCLGHSVLFFCALYFVLSCVPSAWT